MAKINIDEFLSTASPKDVILLYFTYLAKSNISNYTGDEDLLNPEERVKFITYIRNTYKVKKYFDYYNNLVIANRSFLYMYPHIVGLVNGSKYYNVSIFYSISIIKFDIDSKKNKENILLRIEDIKRELPIAKDYIILLKSFLKKYLPLKPYRDFINSQEKILIDTSKQTISNINYYVYSEIPEEERENYYITPYSEIKVNITKERLIELKLAGQ